MLKHIADRIVGRPASYSLRYLRVLAGLDGAVSLTYGVTAWLLSSLPFSFHPLLRIVTLRQNSISDSLAPHPSAFL
jgi:hypothetical protein